MKKVFYLSTVCILLFSSFCFAQKREDVDRKMAPFMMRRGENSDRRMMSFGIRPGEKNVLKKEDRMRGFRSYNQNSVMGKKHSENRSTIKENFAVKRQKQLWQHHRSRNGFNIRKGPIIGKKGELRGKRFNHFYKKEGRDFCNKGHNFNREKIRGRIQPRSYSNRWPQMYRNRLMRR